MIKRIILTCISMVIVTHAHAFKLSPEGTEWDRMRDKIVDYSIWDSIIVGNVEHFTQAVHEEITNRILGCNAEDCSNPDLFMKPALMAGVRWNDDPPFRLKSTISKYKKCTNKTITFITDAACWGKIFFHTEEFVKGQVYPAEFSPESLMQRSHFGDLQFLHVMASNDGEIAAETKKKVMMWAEFTWRVAMGEYPSSTKLIDITIPGFKEIFGKTGGSIQDLFARDNLPLRDLIDQVAFGSLLHMIQDSFSRSHVLRGEAQMDDVCPSGEPKPGIIEEFYSYSNQNHKEHSKHDSRNGLKEHKLENPNVIDVGRDLYKYYKNKNSWETVRPFLDCIFTVEDTERKASGGSVS
ncbi:MAG: hypothetical protein Q7T85_04995 [Nitrosomonas sp.]|nr:hypothetical protein [Nitrosomonas sp.]